MEILPVLTEWPSPTHFCNAILIPKEITMHNRIVINMMKIILQEHKKVKTIKAILWITKLILRIYFMKVMTILTILWITKLIVRISTTKKKGLRLLLITEMGRNVTPSGGLIEGLPKSPPSTTTISL